MAKGDKDDTSNGGDSATTTSTPKSAETVTFTNHVGLSFSVPKSLAPEVQAYIDELAKGVPTVKAGPKGVPPHKQGVPPQKLGAFKIVKNILKCQGEHGNMERSFVIPE